MGCHKLILFRLDWILISLLQEKAGVFKGVLGKSTKSVREETPGQVCLTTSNLQCFFFVFVKITSGCFESFCNYKILLP